MIMYSYNDSVISTPRPRTRRLPFPHYGSPLRGRRSFSPRLDISVRLFFEGGAGRRGRYSSVEHPKFESSSFSQTVISPIARPIKFEAYSDLKFSSFSRSIFPGGPNGCRTACTAADVIGWDADRGAVLATEVGLAGVDQARVGR
jgi:hypothetical protein